MADWIVIDWNRIGDIIGLVGCLMVIGLVVVPVLIYFGLAFVAAWGTSKLIFWVLAYLLVAAICLVVGAVMSNG